MERDVDMWPMTRDALQRIVAYAKSLPKEDAKAYKDVLEQIFRGTNNQEAYELIDSILTHFRKEQDRILTEELQKVAQSKYVKTRLNLPDIEASDEQIGAAITQTVHNDLYRSKRDWGAIYRILVDKCKWVKTYADFAQRIKRLEEGKLLKDITLEKKFNYQAAQAGIDTSWPETYEGWMAETEANSALEHRREVATLFLENLKKAVESSSIN